MVRVRDGGGGGDLCVLTKIEVHVCLCLYEEESV